MKAHHPHEGTVVRKARADNITIITALCGQLGYPTTDAQVRHRFDDIQRREDHCVYVGEGPDGQVIAWVHVFLRPLLVSELCAEIGGLVVDRSQRGEGVGRLLLTAAEAWARERDCDRIVIRSNTLRKSAHAFYQSLGYETIKTQRVFSKTLSEASFS
jgi:GNAT superfamily N-acetyltransferase